MAKMMSVPMPKKPRTMGKPARLNPASAAKIRQKANQLLGK